MDKDLFIKYLKGTCSEDEFDRLITWMMEEALTVENQERVGEIWAEYEPEANPDEKIRYGRILDKVHHTINIKKSSGKQIIGIDWNRSRIWSFITKAAAILLIPVLSVFVIRYFSDKGSFQANLNDLEVQAPAFSRVTMKLGDGSRVWLNHGSHLKYPVHFKGKSRRVFLTGEAYFEVAHNNVPFVVGTDRLDIIATGTAFNVSAYPEDEVVTTALVDGKVIVSQHAGKGLIREMSPHECLKFNTITNTSVVESANIEKHISWKDGKLVFKNDPVAEIAKKLERWYHVEVDVTDQRVQKYTFTATFTGETLPQVLELLSMPTPVVYNLIPREKSADVNIPKQKVEVGFKKQNL